MPTLSTLEDVAQWSSRAKSLKVFLKLDGGGFRAGALPGEAATVACAIAASKTLHLAGVYGHPMASYGPVDPIYTNAQIASCLDALRRIEADQIDHRASPAGALALSRRTAPAGRRSPR